jgi:hypothetical protein
MHASIGRRASALVAALVCAQQAQAQVFVDSPASIPQGSPFNSSQTEQADFADIDLDGDWDVGIADGGEIGPDQNRLWVNQGGLQGGAVGFFADETATRAPAFSDPSRDLEFVDFDGDGDPDVQITNSSSIVNMGGRWWTNQGGLQGGNAGFFTDETNVRWVGLGGAGSSVPPAAVLPSGGFVTFAQDQDFADVDADGDLDLIAATVGGSFSGSEPTRLFLNDGLGFFSEFNPTGFQLSGMNIANGQPALWAEGLQQHNTSNITGAFADIAAVVQEVVVGDIDGDLDVDILLVDRGGTPRMFQNRLSDTGSLLFRDATGLTWPQGWGNGNVKYDTEFGDFDGDLDLDLYGMNWLAAFNDLTLRGNGNGNFLEPSGISATTADDDASDLLDYDADGDLDIFVAGFAGSEKLLRNEFSGGGLLFNPVAGAVAGGPFAPAIDVDAADVDADGDYDLMRAGQGADHLLANVLNAPDLTAARLAKLEQPADHSSGLATPIRVHVYDNAGADLTAFAAHELRYSVDNGVEQSTPMGFMGGQAFLGALPASAVGNVRYFVRSTDEHGNVGLSDIKAIDTGGGCSGQPATYCTAKLNSDGCLPRMEFEGAPKVGGLTSFVIRGTDVLANANGLLIYSKVGPNNAPFNGGVLCVGAGLLRTPGQNSGGSGPCGGTLVFDFNAWVVLGSDPALVAGQKVWAQFWYRDVVSPGGNGLTNGVTFTLCP